jgi:NAD(P)H dehydrogenase (quinone)
MLLVTGATGHLGSSVVAQLLKNSSPNQFMVTSSSSSGIQKLESQGLQARLADFNNLNSLHTAFKGIEKLLLISTMDLNRFEQHKNVVDAAKAQGVKHLIYTSLAIKDIQTSGVKLLMESHFQTEDYIKASGLSYTILRNTMYADALTQILGNNALNQDINLPGGNGKVPYVLRREMGEATANLLLQNGHENKTYTITGSRHVDFTTLAAIISRFSGNTIRYNDITAEDFKEILQQIVLPDFAIYLHTGTLHDIKTGQYEIESKTLEKLLGRPQASMEAIVKELFMVPK